MRFSIVIAFIFLSVFDSGSLFAGVPTSIKGRVLDEQTKEPVIGATIGTSGSTKWTTTGLDGSFSLSHLTDSVIHLTVTHISYHTKEVSIVPAVLGEDESITVRLVSRAVQVEGVVVEGRMDQGSEAAAVRTERMAMNIINTVSAKTIELSPDITAANVVLRISGLSIERNNNGDGQYAIVRGMDKRYNYTMMDDIKVPSPDNKNRYVPLDIFPSDLLDRMEVIKVPTPSMDGDAIGGAVNMVMKNAPPKFYFSVNAATGFGQIGLDRKFRSVQTSTINDHSPQQRNGENYKAQPADFPALNATPRSIATPPNGQIGISLGDRLFNDRLGVVFAGSFQNTYRGSHSIFFSSEVNRNDNTPALQGIQGRDYYAQQMRTGLHMKADYAINDEHTIALFGTYARLILNEVRILSDTNLVLGWEGPGTGRVSQTTRTRHEDQSIFNTSLAGDHIIPFGATLHWLYSYSFAEFSEPDRSEIDVNTGRHKDAQGNIIIDPTYITQTSYRRWSSNTDKDNTVRMDLTIPLSLFDFEAEPKTGIQYRRKTRSNYFDNFTLRPNPSPQIFNGNAANNTFDVFNPFGTPQDALNYDSHENVLAYYGQIGFHIGDLISIAGVRVEQTSFGWESQVPVTVDGKAGSIEYQDILPSITFKYMPTGSQNIRLSYFGSISRPGFFEVIPYTLLNEDYIEQGNPYLKRVQADNYDFRYEYFPGPGEQYLAGAFYKVITNPIEYVLEEKQVNLFYLPDNFGTATNYGFELDVTKYFSQIGFKANYTFTNSQITTPKVVRYRDTGGNLTSRTEDQTRPLQGQSAHIGNLSLLYKDQQNGFDAQIGVSYTGRRIVTVSPFKDNDLWQKGLLVTDVSLEKRILQSLSFFVKVNNVFDAPYEVEIPQHNSAVSEGISYQTVGKNVLIRKDTYGQTYLAGIRYKLE